MLDQLVSIPDNSDLQDMDKQGSENDDDDDPDSQPPISDGSDEPRREIIDLLESQVLGFLMMNSVTNSLDSPTDTQQSVLA